MATMAEDRLEKEALLATVPDKSFTTPHDGDSARAGRLIAPVNLT